MVQAAVCPTFHGATPYALSALHAYLRISTGKRSRLQGWHACQPRQRNRFKRDGTAIISVTGRTRLPEENRPAWPLSVELGRIWRGKVGKNRGFFGLAQNLQK